MILEAVWLGVKVSILVLGLISIGCGCAYIITLVGEFVEDFFESEVAGALAVVWIVISMVSVFVAFIYVYSRGQ